MKALPPSSMPTFVTLVHNHRCEWRAIRHHLESGSDIRVIAEVNDPARAVEIVARSVPDVVLLSAHKPVMEGIAATRLLRAAYPFVGILVLSPEGFLEHSALSAGADAFLPLDAPPEVLLGAVRSISQRSRFRIRDVIRLAEA